MVFEVIPAPTEICLGIEVISILKCWRVAITLLSQNESSRTNKT